MRNGYNPLKGWIFVLAGLLMAAAPALVSAQVSLATVVDMAQRNSSTVRLAEADVRRAQAAVSESENVFVPSLAFGSGLPAGPSVGFFGGVPSIFNATIQSMAFSLPQFHYISSARSGLKAANLSLKDAREQVALSASVDYIELDTVSREIDAARQQEISAGRLVTIEQERAEAGVDPLSELLQARLTAAQLKLKLLHLETRSETLSKQLSVLTGLPVGSITSDRSSIPEIPEVRAGETFQVTKGIESAQMLARSKQQAARGDRLHGFIPQISFSAQYNRSTTLMNDSNYYYLHPIPANNFSSGFQVMVPLFDLGHRSRAKKSAAEALRATVEAEQAQRQNEIQIASLTGNLRELDALAEIATLKQQIAGQQLESVQTQLTMGNGSGSGPNAQPQLTPKAEQLARIDERQKYVDALEASFDLSKARLNLLCALGHMGDWLHELHAK